VLQLIRDSHSEQVWKKTLQPAPTLSGVGGATAGTEFEVHGCLLHAATGQLVPEALRGHVRSIGPLGEEQNLNFSEITIMAKPPSLAKRRGMQNDGTNRYRLLFSLWNSTTLSYVSWQHMSTPLVVRNSFHMLPIEEKNYRRQQYARTRTRGAGGDGDDSTVYRQDSTSLPSLPELEAAELNHSGSSSFSLDSRWLPLSQAPGLSSGSLVRRATSFDTEGSSDADDVSREDLSERSLQLPPPEQELELLRNLAQHQNAALPNSLPTSHAPTDRANSSDSAIEADTEWRVSEIGEISALPIPPQLSAPRTLSAAPNGCIVETPHPAVKDESMSVAEPAPGLTEASSRTRSRERSASLDTGRKSHHGGVSLAPRLLDLSVREGPCSGGSVVWIHGEYFTPEVVILFGDVPVKHSQIVSSRLCKCSSPEAQHQRHHQVRIHAVTSTSGRRSAEELTFMYVPDNPMLADTWMRDSSARNSMRDSQGGYGTATPSWQPELLERLCASLERAHLQSTASSGLTAEQMLRSLDEHGKSLQEYTHGLRKMLTGFSGGGGRTSYARTSYREETADDASELQLGMADLAREQLGHQLETSLAHRPHKEVLLQRNILPVDTDLEKAAKRKRLEEGLAHRPDLDVLKQRNILLNSSPS